MSKRLEARGYRVIIRPDPVEEVTKGGIVIAQNERLAEAARVTGVVVSIGNTAWKHHKVDEPWAKEGERVCYSRYAGKTIVDPETEEELIVINDDDIVAAIIEE